MAMATHWRPLALLFAAVSAFVVAATDKFATNHFLGSCLDGAWVSQVESKFGISASDRDALGRLVRPFLHAALKQTRFHVDDERTSSPRVFVAADLPDGSALYGVGAKVNPVDGSVVDAGRVDRALVVELNGWTTHSLTTLVFSILAREIYGYPVAHFLVTDTLTITQRMSSVLSGVSTPTHLNLEVWIAGIESNLQVYSNESFAAGGLGYFGRSGLYTSVDFIQSALPLFANFWKSYEIHEELITAVPLSSLKKTKFFPPPDQIVCADGSFGCLNNCSRTHACTLREQQTPPKECMVVGMMYDYYDPGYLQAVLSNLNIATYFCFLGYDAMQEFVLDAQRRQQPVLFYHFEPDLFHFHHSGLFDRVFLPRATPERVALATGSFGENGYGNATSNPIDVDFPSTKLSKYAASLVQRDLPLVRLVSQFTLSELDINDLQRKFINASETLGEPDPTFRAACNWIKENYAVWSVWLERLPLCTFNAHVQYDVAGCVDRQGADENEGVRTITFHWVHPDPENSSQPFNCDGGLAALPETIHTSRSCRWIHDDPSRWAGWIDGKPECDNNFFKYSISRCSDNAKRTIHYSWRLPNPDDPSLSLECDRGVTLPQDLQEECDYMPYTSPMFVSIATADGVLAALLLVAMVFVVLQRNAAVIKRSQYELLLLILLGGLLVCTAIIFYAGAPTRFLCGARPAFMSAGFTTIFGALLVKSLRVYRVFMRAGFKKNTVSVSSMIRVFLVIFAVDLAVLAGWYAMDFPEPTTKLRRSVKFDGYVSDLVCASSSFFSAMLMFWKAIVLLVGLYISFLIRNVSSDFQESFWIFGSCVIVLVACIIVLPMAYIVELAPSMFFLFLSSILLVCTALVMAFMMVPKLWRYRTAAAVVVTTLRPGVARTGHSVRSVVQSNYSDPSDVGDQSQTNQSQFDTTPIVPITPGSSGRSVTRSTTPLG